MPTREHSPSATQALRRMARAAPFGLTESEESSDPPSTHAMRRARSGHAGRATFDTGPADKVLERREYAVARGRSLASSVACASTPARVLNAARRRMQRASLWRTQTGSRRRLPHPDTRDLLRPPTVHVASEERRCMAAAGSRRIGAARIRRRRAREPVRARVVVIAGVAICETHNAHAGDRAHERAPAAEMSGGTTHTVQERVRAAESNALSTNVTVRKSLQAVLIWHRLRNQTKGLSTTSCCLALLLASFDAGASMPSTTRATTPTPNSSGPLSSFLLDDDPFADFSAGPCQSTRESLGSLVVAASI
ncbi:hypothetical protein B0H11DRAFT_1901173 [Mycena galericulata]|nr:hypothetical protein B0H11DRAFT_1901173 [Mycena galericulata]